MTPQTVPAGWQVVLADLSLILFIATATAVAGQPAVAIGSQNTVPPAQKVFSSLATGDDIGDWLGNYARDPRERLRVTIQYRRDQFAAALARAEAVKTSASRVGHQPLITLEEHEDNQTTAIFAFEGSPPQLARGLQ